jgi:hypothetical protein
LELVDLVVKDVGDAWPPPPLHYDPPSVQRNRKMRPWERREAVRLAIGWLLRVTYYAAVAYALVWAYQSGRS